MKTIMIVEDFDGTLELLRNIVENGGYKALTYNNGQEAFDNLTAAVDLILCDINMPELNGLEFAFKLHDNEDYKNIPIIFITGENQLKDEARKAGAKAFISKPFSKDKVLAVIEKVL
jgi:two-component system chemotaxis response regulator CheY